jgi:hypothetical protein
MSRGSVAECRWLGTEYPINTGVGSNETELNINPDLDGDEQRHENINTIINTNVFLSGHKSITVVVGFPIISSSFVFACGFQVCEDVGFRFVVSMLSYDIIWCTL